MREMNMKKVISEVGRLLATAGLMLVLTATAYAATPGITGTTFNLVATPASITQPDGAAVYSWGYGCDANASAPSFLPSAITTGICTTMQIPGPTLIVTQGQAITINLTNNDIYLYNDGTTASDGGLINQAGARINLNGSGGTVSGLPPNDYFLNHGEVSKTAGTGTSFLRASVGLLSGTYNAAAGTIIQFKGGTLN